METLLRRCILGMKTPVNTVLTWLCRMATRSLFLDTVPKFRGESHSVTDYEETEIWRCRINDNYFITEPGSG